MSRATSNRRLPVNPWWVVPVLALVAIAALVYQRSRVPDRGDWRAAVEHVKAHLESGDGITWAPYWAGEGRLFFHGLPAFHTPDTSRADLARYDRVWLLGAFGADFDDLPPGHERLDHNRFGGVTVDLVKVVGERVVGDLRADLEQMKVSRRNGDQVESCDFWDGRGWHCTLRRSAEATRRCLAQPVSRRLAQRRRDPHCGLDGWLNVSRDVRVIGDGVRRCVWFHPVAGKRLRIEWAEPPRGEALVIEYGFTDKVITDHTRKASRTKPATLIALHGERELGRQPVAAEKGWFHWRLPLDSGPGGLAIEVESGSQIDAHLCIDVTVRQGAQASGDRP